MAYRRTAFLNRRAVLRGAALTLAAPAILRTSFARADQTLTITSWGGSYRAATEKALVEPFVKETGINVTVVDNADLAKVKAQVETKNVQWDVVDLLGPQITGGARAGLWEPLDHQILSVNNLQAPVSESYAPLAFWAAGIAWDPIRHPNHPTRFKELWDTEAFPGWRGLRTRISETLEAALVADGVSPKKLYPLDVDRGFRSLDRIKPHVKKWIEATAQTITLVQTGEVDYSFSYMSRVRPAQKDGLSIDFSYEQTINSLNYLAAVKNSHNREAAMRYIAHCLAPEQQAAFAEQLSCIPNNSEAMGLISAEAKKFMPDMQSEANVTVDDEWWADNFTALQARFTEWMLI